MADGAGEGHGERTQGFAGAAGRTRAVSTTIWCAGCGTWFGGRWWAAVDGSTDGELLAALLDEGLGGINRNRCPSCSASYVVQEPLVIHRPDHQQLLLVVPNRRMHRAQHARAALIAAVADDPGPVAPSYAREPVLVAGVSGLRGLIGDVTRVSARPASAPPERVEQAPANMETSPRHRAEPSSPPTPELAVDAPADVTTEVSALADAPPSTPAPAHGSSPTSVSGGLLAALMADGDHEPEAPEDRTGPWHDAWTLSEDEETRDARRPGAWSAERAAREGDREAEVDAPAHETVVRDAPAAAASGAPADEPEGAHAHHPTPAEQRPEERLPGPAEGPVEHEPTRVSRMVAPRARLPEGQQSRLVLDDDDVIGLFRVESVEQADRALNDEARLRFQLHRTAAGPAMCLTLVPEADGAPVCWVIDPEADGALLEQLTRRFAVALEAVDGEGALVARRVFDPPLARNVARARERIERAGGSPVQARALVASGAVDRIGQLRHNFTEHAFAACRSAADARLALGILAFWTEPEREAYLIEVQSFPRVWFEPIVARVLAAALDFGLLPPAHLEPRAIEAGLAGDARGLLSRALGAFAELNLSTSLRHNDLDPIDNYENWERLLTRAEALGLAVDGGLRGLALAAMEDARRAAEALDASEAPIELDPDEDVIELESVDEVFDETPAPAGADVTEPLADLIDTALVGLLDDPGRRASAAAVLMQRGETEHRPALARALTGMGTDELVRVLPLGLAHIDALAAELAPALRSPDLAVRRAITLFLAEGRRPEAILALVDQLLDARDGGWVPLAVALAGYGVDVRHLVAGMPLDGEGLERVARVLAAMPEALRETVYDAGARRSTPVMRCLERADRLARTEGVRPGFAHRLEMALSMLAVGDTSGPTRGLSAGGDGGHRFG